MGYLSGFVFITLLFHISMLSGGFREYIKHFNGTYDKTYSVLISLWSAVFVVTAVFLLSNIIH